MLKLALLFVAFGMTVDAQSITGAVTGSVCYYPNPNLPGLPITGVQNLFLRWWRSDR